MRSEMKQHKLFKQRDWKIVDLPAEDMLAKRLDGEGARGVIVASDKPMPPRLTKEEEQFMVDGSFDRVLRTDGHKRFLGTEAVRILRKTWGKVDEESTLISRVYSLKSRIEGRARALCRYALLYHQTSLRMNAELIADGLENLKVRKDIWPILNLRRRIARFKLSGYLAHPTFDKKKADCWIVLPFTRSGRPIPKIVVTDHADPEKLEKLLFSSRDWKVEKRDKVVKVENMPVELTEEERGAGRWLQRGRGKRAVYITTLTSYSTPEQVRDMDIREWWDEKVRNGLRARCGYMMAQRGWQISFRAATTYSSSSPEGALTVYIGPYELDCALRGNGLKILNVKEKVTSLTVAQRYV